MVRRTNGEFVISLHRKVSETALIQLMRTLRALDADFEMNLESAGHLTRHLSRQDVCLRLALRGLSIIERASEPLFMSNLELFDDTRPPPALRSPNMMRLAGLQLAGKDAAAALLEASTANIVRTRRESQTIFYSIDDADVLRITRLLGHIYNDDPVMQRTKH